MFIYIFFSVLFVKSYKIVCMGATWRVVVVVVVTQYSLLSSILWKLLGAQLFRHSCLLLQLFVWSAFRVMYFFFFDIISITRPSLSFRAEWNGKKYRWAQRKNKTFDLMIVIWLDKMFCALPRVRVVTPSRDVKSIFANIYNCCEIRRGKNNCEMRKLGTRRIENEYLHQVQTETSKSVVQFH